MKQTADDLRGVLAATLTDEAVWWPGRGPSTTADGRQKFCACTAIGDYLRVVRPNVWCDRYDRARGAVRRATGQSAAEMLPVWNDAPERTYAEVRAAFELAIAAEEASP